MARRSFSWTDNQLELDALRPDVLEGKIKDAIVAELDADAFNAEVAREDEEIEKITALKARVETFLQ